MTAYIAVIILLICACTYEPYAHRDHDWQPTSYVGSGHSEPIERKKP